MPLHRLDNQILQRLRDNDKTLTSLSLWNNQIRDAGAKALAVAIEKNKALTLLDLTSNEIGDEGAQALAKALKENKTLTSLVLSRNKIGDAGAKALAAALKRNTILTWLDLFFNKIGHEGVKALAAGLEENTALTSLWLEDEQMGNEGKKSLAEALEKNTTLTLLELNDGDEIQEQINSLTARNKNYLGKLQATVLEQLRIGRILLRKWEPEEQDGNTVMILPIELREHIVSGMDKEAHLTEDQQRLILNYAEGKIAPVADKLSFFKVTKCDRVRRQLRQDEVETAVEKLARLKV